MIDLYKECAYLVNQVPEGMVTTYGAVARALGDDIARRAVGVMLNTYGPPIKMPCHRVVYSGGGLGGFAYGLPSKMKMLAEENVFEDNGKIADFENIFFDRFKTTHPLKKAREEQLMLAKKVKLANPTKMPKFVLGLDVGYIGTRAFGAGVLFDLEKKESVRTLTTEVRINWPYVPTYLGYREMPVYEQILKKIDGPVILMIDGNGTLHPFGLGIASHIGMALDMPAIGVAKTKLCGEISAEPRRLGESQPVILDRKEIGRALKTSERANPIFVSPGHKIAAASALEIVKKTARLKLPEPIRLAHQKAAELRRASA